MPEPSKPLPGGPCNAWQPWRGPERVLQQLTSDGWLKTIAWLDEIDSTSSYAKSLVGTPALAGEDCLPAMFVAARQTAGRGRVGRSWFSDQGTLTMSLVLGTEQLVQPQQDWSQLALVSGLALSDLLNDLLEPQRAMLKWPNDVYVGQRKIAGVLIETAGPRAEVAVVGVGLNVATDFSDAPREVQQKATSVKDAGGMEMSPWDVLPALVQCIRRRIAQWGDDTQSLVPDFRRVCLLTGCRVTLHSGDQCIRGTCQGIDAQGRLLITEAGQTISVRSGEIVDWERAE